MGNYLRSEILHQSGSPHAKPRELSEERKRAWAEEAKRLCVMSYQTGGLTVPKEVAEEGKERGEREEVVPPRSLLQERLALPLMRYRGSEGVYRGEEA